MRPRFSIRWLLVLIGLSAALCYVLFVRPTVLAHRFVDAVETGDYESAKSLLFDQDLWALSLRSEGFTSSIDRVYAEVSPREWSDIWALRRRLILRVSYHDDTDERHIEWTEDIDLTAHINGVKIIYESDDLFGPI